MQVFLKLILLSLLGVFAEASQKYCARNETTIKLIPVTKTRVLVKKPTGAFKWFKKTKYQTEIYEDFEEQRHVETINGCCDGYKMVGRTCYPACEQSCPKNAFCAEPNICECDAGLVSAVSSTDGSHFCEPICKGGCPLNARCVEPDLCECEHGYHKMPDELVCQPRCSSGCPHGGQCIFPEQCECTEGYSAESGTCRPICSAGDGCQYGKCVEPERCICHSGYIMNELNQLCEKEPCNEGFEDCYDEQQTTEAEESWESVTKDEPEEDELFSMSPIPIEYDEGDASNRCPPNFFYYNNACRRKQFASNEFDCRFRPCMEHAFCQANGTCACKEGFFLYKHKNDEASSYDSSTTEGSIEESSFDENWTEESTTDASTTTETAETGPAVCLTAAQIYALETARKADMNDDDEDPMDWMSLCVITLGVLCILGALCFLVFKLLRHQQGKLDVEAKNDLTCSYDNRNYSNSTHVY